MILIWSLGKITSKEVAKKAERWRPKVKKSKKKSAPGRGDSMYKGPEAAVSLVYLKPPTESVELEHQQAGGREYIRHLGICGVCILVSWRWELTNGFQQKNELSKSWLQEPSEAGRSRCKISHCWGWILVLQFTGCVTTRLWPHQHWCSSTQVDLLLNS